MPNNNLLPELWMKRAQTLAERGLGFVSPNPLVGCVIVHQNQIIGEGWHKQYGEPHAEVEAIKSVSNHDLLAESTVYVTLEPCAHYGKTPPCADLLMEKKVPHVVIGHQDPHPLVAGKGVEKLRQADMKVDVGLLENECRFQNRRFLTKVEKNRPYIILKWAQSADGFMGRTGEKIWISSPASKLLVHSWRTEEDAFLVGANTVVNDNPKLNARFWPGKNPMRIVIDPDHIVPESAHVLDGTQPTFIFTADPEKVAKKNEVGLATFVLLQQENPEIELLRSLVQQGINSVVVEGGTYTINRFIHLNLWDEARVFLSEKNLKMGIEVPTISISRASATNMDTDYLHTFYNPKSS